MTTSNPPAATTVCIAGCGPAGAVLGLLLARAGIDVVVLEKHADFLRDFRGDTVHASTMQVLAELDLLEGFEELPQQRTTSISLMTDDGFVTLGDFTRLPGRFRCLSMVPQWELLDFLTAEAARAPSFALPPPGGGGGRGGARGGAAGPPPRRRRAVPLLRPAPAGGGGGARGGERHGDRGPPPADRRRRLRGGAARAGPRRCARTPPHRAPGAGGAPG